MIAAANAAPPNGRRERPAPVDRRKLPHNIEAEASVLGGIIVRNEVLALLPELESADFYHPKHRLVFEAMRNLEAAGRPIDVVTLEDEIDKAGNLEAVGGPAFLGELCLRLPSVDNVTEYASIVRVAARNRDAIVEIGSVLQRGIDWPHDPAEMIRELVGQLQRFDQEQGGAKSEQKARWCTPLEGFLGDDEPDDDDSEDWIVRDLVPRSEPVLWGGPMKGGKTWAALDLAIAIARGESWVGFGNTLGPVRALGLFLEDSKRRIRKRVWELCRGRPTPTGFMSPNDDLVRANLRITRTPLRIPDPRDVKRFAAEIKAWGARFVVIDNLTRIFVGDPNSTRDAAAFTRAWCDLCEETGAAILLLHHTKKVGAGDKDIDPFDTLRGSGDFGAAARNIIVVSPIRQDDGPALAEIRMRGNLDLRRDGFVLGFERDQLLGKWRARMVDKGDIGDVKGEIKKQHVARKEQEKKTITAEKYRLRRERAIALARDGGVSQARLANELGLTPRALAPLLNGLVVDGLMRKDPVRGYVMADDQGPIDPPQGDLL